MKLFASIILSGFLISRTIAAENPYPPGPDSQKQEGVSQGEIVKGIYTSGTRSVFPRTVHDYYVYVPQQLDRTQSEKEPVTREILADGAEWQRVRGDYAASGPMAVNAKGEVYFSDNSKNLIRKISPGREITVFATDAQGIAGMAFGPNGRLYVTETTWAEMSSYGEDGKRSVILHDFNGARFCFTHLGQAYMTFPRRILLLQRDFKRILADPSGEDSPGGLWPCLSPDQSLLYVADAHGPYVWSYQIAEDGSLAFKQRYYRLHHADGSTQGGAGGMTVDQDGRLYVTTEAGLQFYDQAGRVNGILGKPQNEALANVIFGGSNLDELYVICGDQVYRRQTRVKGVLSAQPPIKLGAPRL